MTSQLRKSVLYIIVRMICVVTCCAMSSAFAWCEELAIDTLLSLNEVSVTAIKQGWDVRHLPASTTLVTRDRVEQKRMLTIRNASNVVPNLYIPDYGSRVTSSIYVRGLGARIDQPVMGLNIDNIPYMNKDNYDFDLFDIDRIEVLRGPQSTLYGRNTMGGVINIYTLSPLQYQGVRMMAEYSSGNSYRLGVSAYERFNPEFGMSLSIYAGKSDGFFVNANDGIKCDHDKSLSMRWKTQWRPTSTLSIDNVLGIQDSKQGGYPYQYVETGAINYNDTCFYKRFAITDGVTVKWTLEDVVLSSITSVQWHDDNMTLDQDFLPLSYFTLTQARRELSLTQDFVAKGVGDQYKWLGGLFGFYKRGLMDAPVTFKDYGIKQLIVENRNNANPYYPISWDDDEFELWSDFVNPTIGVALYHQSTLSIGRWNLSAGLRFDVEHSTLEYRSKCNTGYWVWDATVTPIKQMRKELINIDDGGKLSKTFVQLLPKLTASYGFVEDKMRVYASVSKGYKAGGFNTQMFSDVLQQRVMGMMGLAQLYDVDEVVTYKPEYSWNYEIGGHAELFDGKLKTEMSLFYIDCRDQQLTIFPEGTTTGRIMTNAGKTRSYGVELSARYKPIECLSLDASYGFTDARFREYNNGKTDFSGKKIPYSPENTLYGGANYSAPLRCFIFDSIDLAVNCRAVGDIAWDEANMVSQPFYALLGASVRLNCEKYNMSMDIWGENLTNVKYSTFYFVSIGNAFLQQGKPQRFGITLRMNI